MTTVDEVLNAIDGERRKVTNFHGTFLWFHEFPDVSVGNGWVLGEVMTRDQRLFSDVQIHDDRQGYVVANTGWLDSQEYSTLRQPDQPLTSLQQLNKLLSSLHHMIFEAMQIDLPGEEQWSKRLGQKSIALVGEETFQDLSCLRLEWNQMTEIGPRYGYWLVCPERDYKIVYSETFTPGTAHGWDAEMIEVTSINQFQLRDGNWIPTLTTFVQGRLHPDGRRELNRSQNVTEIIDLEIGCVKADEPMLTVPLHPGLELILEGGRRRRIRATPRQQWTSLKQRLAVGAR